MFCNYYSKYHFLELCCVEASDIFMQNWQTREYQPSWDRTFLTLVFKSIKKVELQLKM